ncbi:MAG: Sporulation protein RMD1 (Required for meiotic nuclear divisionprotein 1) [uncultured bacterium]|nr:MAG: Sporulation protein RMD1 (Required for meiotic nuclear divisionprotein 1) [uncultured bacterium]
MGHPRSFMRCVSFCTAGSYDLRELANSFKRKDYVTRLLRDVLHVASTKKTADIFFFSHGSFVCWGFNKRQEQKWVDYVKEFSSNSLAVIETDHFCYRFGEETSIDAHERFKIDIITLDSDNAQIKLAISYGLAQAIKLEAFEDAIQETVKINASLPEEIARHGITSLSRRSLFKRIGEIFIARSSINLNSEYLDTPEFFWRNPNLEPFYMITKKFLDIPSRVTSLNQKLDVLQELFDMLNSQVQHRHSSMLETIIILLILIEIVISILQFHVW